MIAAGRSCAEAAHHFFVFPISSARSGCVGRFRERPLAELSPPDAHCGCVCRCRAKRYFGRILANKLCGMFGIDVPIFAFTQCRDGAERIRGFWCIQRHCGPICGVLCFASFFYASAIAHPALRDQPRRRRPRSNENCLLRMRCASSMPEIVIAAFANELNPAIDARRRLIARWSCSMRLFKYVLVRTFAWRQHGCSRRLGTWLSSVILRGTRGSVEEAVKARVTSSTILSRNKDKFSDMGLLHKILLGLPNL
jgi:hypothetical protein